MTGALFFCLAVALSATPTVLFVAFIEIKSRRRAKTLHNRLMASMLDRKYD